MKVKDVAVLLNNQFEVRHALSGAVLFDSTWDDPDEAKWFKVRSLKIDDMDIENNGTVSYLLIWAL